MRRIWLWVPAGVAVLAGVGWVLIKTDALSLIGDGSRLHAWVQGFGG